MRVSDEDRTRAVAELRRHLVAGRLEVDDYATRVAEAYAAEDLTALDRALRDLPRVSIADPRPDPPIFAPDGGDPDDDGMGMWRARAVLIVSAVVIVAGLVFVIVAQWLWAVILVVAWLAGLVQGRIPLRRRT